MPAPHHRGRVVAFLGTAQILAWASSQYLPAVLAAPMARSLGLTEPTVFAAFSMALGASALTGPWAGRAIDRLGGRPVLMASNVVFALGLAVLGLSANAWMLFAGWMLLGVGMGSGPDLERLSTLRRQAPARCRLYAAGGLRDKGDLAALAEIGVSGILVASALHDGRL